ncbi:MAG: AAA family ATPase, partial [Firmicutes bacterium]|nr:AAA family ATPase [Bacillota bacterium]
LYQEARNSQIFVDKSLFIERISQNIRTSSKCICITRPRRFGKTVNANMLATYYTKGLDSGSLFSDLKIAQPSVDSKGDLKKPFYPTHLNQYNVIKIDFSQMPDDCNSYAAYIGSIRSKLKQDLGDSYPELDPMAYDSLSSFFEATGDSFIFILDEWDAIFHRRFVTEKDKEDFLEFLRDLLKDKAYVELAYMTGVLPIAKYSSGSAINMFREDHALKIGRYEEFFGFTEQEVKALGGEHQTVSYEELKQWYDGYRMKNGASLFNPRSVAYALMDGECQNYWTETGPMNEVADCIEHNAGEVREDIVQMVAGNPVEVELSGYSAAEQSMNTRDEILSAMVVYGFLSYHEEELQIPNHELMLKFQKVLSRSSMGGISEIVKQSKAMLQATLAEDEEKVAAILKETHNREIPFLQYNDENSLSCIITLCYLYARKDYQIDREIQTGSGYCDYLFTPKKAGKPAIVLELKAGKSAEEAIRQIKNRDYAAKVRKYKDILLVGINYNPDDTAKPHDCIIERIRVTEV